MYNAAYSTALPFPRPTGVLTPRFAKISAQIDFAGLVVSGWW